MNVRLEPIAEKHGHLLISITPDDYKPKLSAELKKIKKTAHIKGFRQGTVPDSMVEKLYGEEVKADILNKLINQIITDYQKDTNQQFLGDLIETPSDNKSSDDGLFEFKFEVGFAPDPDINNLLADVSLVKYKVDIPEERIDEEIDHICSRMGESLETNEAIIREDLVEIEAVELEDDKPKEGGWTTQFPVSISEYTHDHFINLVLGLKVSDMFRFNIQEVEKNLSQKDINKYLLKIPEDQTDLAQPGDHYQATIVKVMRKQKAQLGEELYKKAFGPESTISNETELRAEIRSNLEKYFDQECDKLLDIELVKKLVSFSDMKYPEQFLIKWLKSNYEEWKDKEGHDLEHQLLHFKEGMSWKIIREKIMDQEKIKVTIEDVYDSVIHELKMQYPGIQLPPEHWNELAKRALSDKEKAMHYFVEGQNRKVIAWIKEKLNIEGNEMISMDKFREKVKHINEHHH